MITPSLLIIMFLPVLVFAGFATALTWFEDTVSDNSFSNHPQH